MSLFATMTADVLPRDDLPTMCMYAFCLMSGWFMTRWMVQKRMTKIQDQAAATKIAEMDSQPALDVVGPIVLDKKSVRANAESRRRAKKVLGKTAAIATKKVLEVDCAHTDAVVAQKPPSAVDVPVPQNSNMAEIVEDAKDGNDDVSMPPCNLTIDFDVKEGCDTKDKESPNLNTEADSSQIAIDDGAVELQSSQSVRSGVDQEVTIEPSSDKATVLSTPRTQADKNRLKLEKKIREVESLKQRMAEGQELQPNQLEKLAQESYFREQVLALAEGGLEDQSESDCVLLPKASLQATAEDSESLSTEEPVTGCSGKEISDETDGSSTRSSDDVQELGYKLDWNDPAWESAEQPCLRFSSLPEGEEEEDEAYEMPEAAAPTQTPTQDGSFYMPVGFINHDQEYFPFMEVPIQQTDVFLEPAVLQKIVVEPTVFEPVAYGQSEYMQHESQIEQPGNEWSPAASHADWEGLGEKRGVQQSFNNRTSSFSRDAWETNNQSKWHKHYQKSPAPPRDSWENQGKGWDEPWGM